jgi:predicted Zn-dependent protease
MKKTVFFLVALVVFCSCGSVPVTGRKQLLLVSDSEVISASMAQYGSYIKTAPVSADRTKTEMVVRVGEKIAAATENYLRQNGLESEIAKLKWEFNLVAQNDVNAFCMPGGKIVVYEGLLKLVASDDELGVVLGHEVAHAVAKHSNERMSQELLTQYGAIIVSDALSKKSAAIQNVGNTVFGLGSQLGVMLPYSRKHEYEADQMGLVLMTLAGYDPGKAVSFWRKMAAGGSHTLEFLSTHPSDEHRISEIEKYLPEMDKYRK